MAGASKTTARSGDPRSFTGTIATTGNSRGLRLEKAFFKAAPEFGTTGSAIQADLIGPGTVLISVDAPSPEAVGEQVIEADTAGGGQRGEDMAMRQGAADFEPALAGRDELVAAQGGAQRLDFLVRPMGEIGKGAGFNLAVLAIALAQEDGRR